MAAEEKSASRGTMATMVATAAVTLALGVTVAALGGYLGPARVAPPNEVAAPDSAPAQAAEASSASRVVLVPIAPELPAAPESLAASPAEGRVAAYPAGGAGAAEDEDEDEDEDDEGRDDEDDDGGERRHEGEHDDD